MCSHDLPEMSALRHLRACAYISGVPRKSSHFNNFSDPAQALGMQNSIAIKSLDCYHRGWHGVISSIWNTLPAELLLQAMQWVGTPC